MGVPARLGSSFGVHPTRHAYERAEAKGFTLPTLIPAGSQVVEVEMLDGVVTKLVVRFPYDGGRDMVAVVRRGNVLITAWLNAKGDGHMTLDAGKYVK